MNHDRRAIRVDLRDCRRKAGGLGITEGPDEEYIPTTHHQSFDLRRSNKAREGRGENRNGFGSEGTSEELFAPCCSTRSCALMSYNRNDAYNKRDVQFHAG